jgi:type I restriction enzyme M protein
MCYAPAGEIRSVNHQALASFIWSVADLLRGDFKQSEYGRVILPFTVLRRLDCVLAPTKDAVLAELAAKQAAGLNPEAFLLRKAEQGFYNTDPLDVAKLMGDQDNIRANLIRYVEGFSPAVRDIFEQFEFHAQIDRLAKTGLLYQVTEKFAGGDPPYGQPAVRRGRRRPDQAGDRPYDIRSDCGHGRDAVHRG